MSYGQDKGVNANYVGSLKFCDHFFHLPNFFFNISISECRMRKAAVNGKFAVPKKF